MPERSGEHSYEAVESHNSFTGDDVLLISSSLLSQLKDTRPSNTDHFGYLPDQIEMKNVIQYCNKYFMQNYLI